MKSCKILRYGAVCGLAALAAVGCSVDDAETIRVRELTAAEHELFVPASGGTAQIQLYSNGRVRVEALNDIGGWASVDRSEFDGDRMVSVTFTENDSFRRMAKLRFVLDGGTRADTVCIKQYGVVPSLECPAPYKAIRGSVETFTQFEIDTNIPLGDFAVATAYVGPTRDWIRSVQPEQGMLVVDTKPNPGDDVCKAVVNLSYVDGWEETFSANLYITQADKDDEFGREVSFADVRALATAEGTAVDEDILIEGIVVSDFHSKNMEANPSVSYDKVDVTVNDCTAYLESPDGRYGFPPALRHAGGQRAGARHAPLALAQRHGPHARGESRALHDQQPGRRKHGRKRCRRGDSRQAAPDFGTDRRRRLHLRLARKHRIPVQGGQLCQRLRKLQPFVRCQRLADGQQQPHGRLGVAADGRRGKFDLRTGQHALPLAAFGSGRPAGDGHDPRHRGAQRIAALRQRGALPDPRARRVGLRHGMGRGVGLYGVCRMGRQPSQILVRDLCQVQQPVCL